jgi:hypothetical protein
VLFPNAATANVRRMRRVAPYLLVVAGAVVISALLPAPKSDTQPDAGEVARQTGIRILGATRGYATTALWLRAGDAYDRGDLYETLAAYQLIRELQPRNPAVYSYLSWNQAYNISAQFPDVAERRKWVARGLNTLHEGQDRLPRDASLRMDEWHFLLNRSVSYPATVLQIELRLPGPAWRLLTERALQLHDALSETDEAALEDFLENTGLQLNLFDTADELYALPAAERTRLLTTNDPSEDFADYERAQMRALFALSPDVQGFLALAHWCRLHAMFLVIAPAVEMHPHAISVERAVLNTALLASARVPPGVPPEEFEGQYKEAVAEAFVSGIENALRIGGQKLASEFLDDMKFNFRDRPDLLPAEVIDRAYQEIQ